MAVDVKYRISAEDATKKGVDSAKRNLDGLDGGVKSFSKSIKDSIKPLTDMRSAMQALTMGTGIALLFREGAKAVGETINAYAKHNAAFADTMKKAQEAVNGLKVELGAMVAEIAGPGMAHLTKALEEITKNLKAARTVKETIQAATLGTLTLNLQKIDQDIASTQEELRRRMEQLAKTGLPFEKLPAGNTMRVEIERSRQALEILQRQRVEAQRLFDATKSGMDDLLAAINRTNQDAIATAEELAAMRDVYGSSAWMFGEFVPDREAPGYAKEIVSVIYGSMVDYAEMQAAGYAASMLDAMFNAIGTQSVVGNYVPGAPVPDMEDMGIQGATAGSRDASLGGVVAALSAVGDGLMSFLGAIAGASVSLQLILNPLSTIFNAMMSVLGPLLDQVLAPIVGVLVIIGQALGQILAPVIQALSPVIELLAKAFVWLYNEILVPVGNGISVVLQALMNAFKGVVNFFIRILNKLGANITELTIDAIDRQTLSPITYDDLTAAGTTTIGGAGGYTAGGNNPYGPGRGAGAQYSSPRIIHVAPGASLIKVETSALVGSGGFQDFVVMVRNELQRIEALGY